MIEGQSLIESIDLLKGKEKREVSGIKIPE